MELTKQAQSNISSSLSKYLALILLNIIKDNPDYLLDKFRDYKWDDSKLQSNLIEHFNKYLNEQASEEKLLKTAIALFRQFLMPFTLDDQKIIRLLINGYLFEINTSRENILQSSSDFSILLVDVENITLDITAEDFIKKACQYPLKHCLAFGNWKKLGNKDEELHDRGYELFHVPQGKNNADQRMTNISSFICLNYPGIKEIFVCSSDRDFDILCNFLSTKNIDVYRVFRKVNNLCIKNMKTEVIESYPIIANVKIQNLEILIPQLKEIIKQELKNNMNQPWLKLSQIASLFDQKYSPSLNLVVEHHFPGKKAEDIFSEYKSEFAVHYPPGSTEVFITLFDVSSLNQSSSENNQNKLKPPVYTKESIEKMLISIVREEIKNQKIDKITLVYIASKFAKNHKISITQAFKEAKLNISYKSFIKSSKELDIITEGNQDFIRIRLNKA